MEVDHPRLGKDEGSPQRLGRVPVHSILRISSVMRGTSSRAERTSAMGWRSMRSSALGSSWIPVGSVRGSNRGIRQRAKSEMVERGVRLIQICHGGGHQQQNWDAHDGVEENRRVHGPEIIRGVLA